MDTTTPLPDTVLVRRYLTSGRITRQDDTEHSTHVPVDGSLPIEFHLPDAHCNPDIEPSEDLPALYLFAGLNDNHYAHLEHRHLKLITETLSTGNKQVLSVEGHSQYYHPRSDSISTHDGTVPLTSDPISAGNRTGVELTIGKNTTSGFAAQFTPPQTQHLKSLFFHLIDNEIPQKSVHETLYEIGSDGERQPLKTVPNQ